MESQDWLRGFFTFLIGERWMQGGWWLGDEEIILTNLDEWLGFKVNLTLHMSFDWW